MAPLNNIDKRFPVPSTRIGPPTRASLSIEDGFLEAWAQGYMVGALIVLILIVFCNYRSGIWLHKFVLLELILALGHGTFIFAKDPVYGWYLSITATLLFISYQIHNVVSWLKIKPFLPTWGSRLFIISLIVVQPFWIAEAWSNFEYFNNLGSEANVKTRPWEALFRDPWWLFTTWKLIDAIKKSYGFKLWALVRINSRFGVMLACMFISIAFLLTDVVVNALHITSASGINPYWRFALVFKCASDTIFLDDFKSVLDDIVARKFGGASGTIRGASIQGGRQHFIRDGYSFIEYGPETDMSPQPPTTTESKHFNPFHRRGNSTSTPKIHVHRDTTVTTEVRSASQDGYVHVPTLTIPAPAIYNHRQQNDGSRSLLIGRLSSDK